MIVAETIAEVRKNRWLDPSASWGLVPTMGYLHEGHLSLARTSLQQNTHTAASIFINPTQFAKGEDLSTYPRKIDDDLKMLEKNGVDLVFIPQDKEIYPDGYQTTVAVTQITKKLEGTSRPTHFQGVTTIVTKLLNIFQPTRAYFGQKDFQQTVVLQRMVKDLNINTDLIICPIIREADGLAMSSRNSYLSKEERAAALVVSRAWKSALGALDNGETNGDVIRQTMHNVIAQEPLAKVDYVSFAHPETLEELDTPVDGAILSLAAFFGKTRLIDNHIWKPNEQLSITNYQ